MTEELQENLPEQQEETRPGTGRLLAEAREKLGLSIEDVARQLRLSPRQIEALEADDHARLPGMTFLRGFIRNYARLLQLDPEPLLAGFGENKPMSQSIVVPTSRIEFGGKRRLLPFTDHIGKPWMKYGLVAVTVLLALAWAGYEVSQMQPSPDAEPIKAEGETTLSLPLPQPDAAAPSPAVPATEAGAEPRAEVPAVLPAPVTVAPPAAVPPAPPATPATASGSAAEASGMRLGFVFDGDAWVEVRDKSGRIVFSQLNPKGTQQLVRGIPPFALVVGNAAHVRLTYNDKPVDLMPYVKVDVARLTIE